MTLKQFLKSEQIKLFFSYTKVYIESHSGNTYYLIKFNNNIHLNDALTKLDNGTLSKEIALVEAQPEALVFHFVEE